MELYTVINNKGEKVGAVTIYSEKKQLKLSNNNFSHFFNNIDEIFNYTKSNKLSLMDMQGDVYSQEIHNEVIKGVNKLGIGYFIR